MLVREAGFVLGPREVPWIDADALCEETVSEQPLKLGYMADTNA
jgi:hypothetical protein